MFRWINSPWALENVMNYKQVFECYKKLFPQIWISKSKFKNDSLYRLFEMSVYFYWKDKISWFERLKYFDASDIDWIKDFVYSYDLKEKIYSWKVFILLDYVDKVDWIYFVESIDLSDEEIDEKFNNLKKETRDEFAKITDSLNIL